MCWGCLAVNYRFLEGYIRVMPELRAPELLEFQPNRYPFLMIDVVTDFSPGRFANGYKNLTNNEWFFPEHFPGNPNMPGALQLEAMAQMLTIAVTTIDGLRGSVTHAIEHRVRFRREVVPGDCLTIRATVSSWKRGVCRGSAECRVDGVLVSDADMVIAIPEILEAHLPRKS